jgi:hypothetical protein
VPTRTIAGVALALSLAAAITLAVMYRRKATELAHVQTERALVCKARAWRLTSILAEKVSNDLRAQVLPLTEPTVSMMCLGTDNPVDIREASACWAETGKDLCYRPVVEKLQPLYASAGWR